MTDRDNDELVIEREVLPLIAMWMSPGQVVRKVLVIRSQYPGGLVNILSIILLLF